MRTWFRLLATPILAVLLWTPTARAQGTGVEYDLAEASMFEAGCLPPCMCPVLHRAPLKGSFRLVEVPIDAPFQMYQVLDVDWSLSAVNGGVVHVHGSGTYRLNTPSQGYQQLVLDLSVDGGEVQRYDSGLVMGGDLFPLIRLPVALHGFFCHDSVYGVDATPRTASVGSTEVRAELSAGPNPFTGGTEIGFSLPSAAAIDLRIFDLAGREVRTLVDRRSLLSAGNHRIGWDGVRRDGREASAGVYFARLRAPGGEKRLTLVKRE